MLDISNVQIIFARCDYKNMHFNDFICNNECELVMRIRCKREKKEKQATIATIITTTTEKQPLRFK